MNTLLIGCLAVVDPLLHKELTLEDKLVEDATAVLFLLSGVLLFGTAVAERKLALRCVYVLGGALMVFVGGEEISWGQRIFGFATPDFLASVNNQNEFNVHNIDLHSMHKIHEYGTLALCVLTCAALFSRKDSLFRIPLPSILLMLSFIVMMTHRYPNSLSLYFIFQREILLLTLLLAYALISERYKLLIATASTVAIVIALSYVNITYIDRYGIYDLQPIIEPREYMLSICCIFYSLELLLAQKAARNKLGEMFDRISLSIRPSWLQPRDTRAPEAGTVAGFMPYIFPAASALVILASIGLTVLQYNIKKIEHNRFESTYQSLLSRDPEARSNFDIYLEENQLIYLKQPCVLSDTDSRFFLHVIPTHTDDLPSIRKQYGFDNLDFEFWLYRFYRESMTFDDVCMAKVELPEYAIDRIRTGQYNTDGQIWKAEFPFPQ